MDEAITPDMWGCLERLAKTEVMFDYPGAKDSDSTRLYDSLVKRGYASVQNTGEGDSIIEYAITPEGRQALASYRGDDAR